MGARAGVRGIAVAAAVIAAAGAAQLAVAAGGEPPSENGSAGPQRPQIGVVPQRELTPGEGRRMRAAGITSVRFWLAWSQVEQERDRYSWGPVDAVVRELASAGLTPLPFLFGTPGWAGERDRHGCSGNGCIPFPPSSIETRYAFARFAGAAVRRYGPDGGFWQDHPNLPYRPIRAWQVWNEQNLEAFHMPDVDVPTYASMLELVADEIHAADPGAEVILGGMFGKRTNARIVGAARFLRALYRIPGIEEKFDGVALHPYDPRARGVIEQVRNARRVIRDQGDDAGLWVTELGWASGGDRSENLVTTRKAQARLLRRSFTQILRKARRWRLRGIYWYAWRDTVAIDDETVCAWCPRSGLVNHRGRPKPAFKALRAIARRR